MVGEKTKHCGQCNRCVNVFDHHCEWLGNCVGASNYKWFILQLIFGFLVVLVHNMVNITNLRPSVGMSQMVIYFFNALPLLFFTHLLCLHIYLYCTNQTTYEYLKKEQLKENEEDEEN